MVDTRPVGAERRIDSLSEQPPISIIVSRSDLQSVGGNGLQKVSWFARQKFIHAHKRILVESAPEGMRDSIFYASERAHTNIRVTPAEFVQFDPFQNEDMVTENDDFELSFVGMSISRQDSVVTGNNELLLYSLRTRDDSAKSINDPGNASTENRSSQDSHVLSFGRNGYAPGPTDIPFIHYDPVVDGHDMGSEPDSYVPIPSSKGLYLQSRRQERRGAQTRNVSVRFNVLEIDQLSDMQMRAISGLGNMGQFVGKGAIAAPQLGLLSKALEVTSVLGKKGLEKYSEPDLVLTKDIEFKLAPLATQSDARSASSGEETEEFDLRGNYLRYGYYFFLNKAVDAQLYAQVGASSQQIPLLLKREDLDPRIAPANEKTYFPLTGISYVVMKVSRGASHRRPSHETQLSEEHRERLSGMLQLSSMVESFSNLNMQRGPLDFTAVSKAKSRR